METDAEKQIKEDKVENPVNRIRAPKDFTEPDVLYQELEDGIKTRSDADLELIRKAYHLANSKHNGIKRKSGEPYIIHPICVAIILNEIHMDMETIASGLLHDVVEDTDVTLEDLTEEFGETIAMLVDGVTKLTHIKWSLGNNGSREAMEADKQAENLRKLFLAMAKDIRVVMIKLADRLHNMRTLQYMKPEKQIQKAQETMDIFAPIADRLGISKIKIELDDLALMYLKPDIYQELCEKLILTQSKREQLISQIQADVSQYMEEAGIQCQISGRVKHLFSIYKKMVKQNKSLEQIYDIFAVRIIVDTVRDCYGALGVVHEKYKPMAGRFKDYIATPKPNGYRSLHTTLVGNYGQMFEIQIRTKEMHEIAEYGIAAHWKYKEKGSNETSLKADEEKFTWLSHMLEYQNDDNQEFLSSVKNEFNLFSDNIYCFAPDGKVVDLPKGSNPIDFAYNIHSEVGNKMVGAKANGKLVPIDYEIQNGDRMQILTSKTAKGPSRDWLKIVKSSQARSKINQWFKHQLKEENIIRGKELITDYCKSKSLVVSDLLKPEFQQAVLEKYGFRTWDAVLAAIGHGGLKEGQIVNKLLDEYKKKKKSEMTDSELIESAINKSLDNEGLSKHNGDIIVTGSSDFAKHMSRCCSPLPGDDIVAYVTRGRGISIHRIDCGNIRNLSEEERVRLQPAKWDLEGVKNNPNGYTISIRIYGKAHPTLVADVTRLFGERKINITGFNSSHALAGDPIVIEVSFVVKDMEEYCSLLAKLKTLPRVENVKRLGG
ncbi:MAG: RelA/SpoT family protein [Lachnospiraceae bacterium]